MSEMDLILLHPPSVFKFRELPLFFGPVSDVVPSSSVFEIYPIGFLTISEYLTRAGMQVRIINMAMKMLRDKAFDPEIFISRLRSPLAFGIDLHWLPHVDGSLSLAELVKKHHPDTPVILGGLSATYFYEEIMHDYPFVDFVVCGESAEEPLRSLVKAIKTDGGYEEVPNLVWRDAHGRIRVNERSFKPENLDYIHFDYPHLLKMAIRYLDPSGYIPFKYWLSYPVTAVFSVRGCNHNCGTCGGSLSAFKKVCMRQPCFRSPELVAEDIRRIAEYTGAPVMVIGDLLQAGREYSDRFLNAVKKARIRNEICIEFFSPPPAEFLEKVSESLSTFNVEISPESHDINIRKTFGKSYSNTELEDMIENLLSVGCKRIDLFFMAGLPYQDYESVMNTVDYCGELLARYGTGDGSGRILPLIAPLAPFIDPGSTIFEEPEKYEYRFFYRTLKEHRQAMLMPSWKFTLNYETKWMTRDEIVRATYNGALRLIELKERYGVIGASKAGRVREHLTRAIALSKKIIDPSHVDNDLEEEIMNLNTLDQVCDKHELDWPVKGWKLKVPNIIKLLLTEASPGPCRAFFAPFKKWSRCL